MAFHSLVRSYSHTTLVSRLSAASDYSCNFVENAPAGIRGRVAHLLRHHKFRFVDLRPRLREELCRTYSVFDGWVASIQRDPELDVLPQFIHQ
jgi:hypothetical protein